MTTQDSKETIVLMTRGLRKSYGKVQALRGVDLEVRRGEILGFLGPNGAGKTTTIRCLLDLIRPDGGTPATLLLGRNGQPVLRLPWIPASLAVLAQYLFDI